MNNSISDNSVEVSENTFSFIPPFHPVIKAQSKPTLRPSKDRTPWVYVDWFDADSGFWWVRTPVSNTGVKSNVDNHCEGQKCHIDWLTVSFAECCITGAIKFEKDHFTRLEGVGSPDSGLHLGWSYFINDLLEGTGICVSAMTPRPAKNWKYTVRLLDDSGVECGWIGYGGKGQNGRCQLSLDGSGCSVVNQLDMMRVIADRLHKLSEKYEGRILPDSGGVPQFAKEVVRITRADIAYDDIEGRYGVKDVEAAWYAGEFNGRGRRPKSRWNGDCNGENSRTFYVGTREKTLKYWRSYEKGHQLGDMLSKWVRHEVEVKRNKQAGYLVPIDILENPDAYFAGMYSFSAKLLEGVEPKTIQRVMAEKIKLTFLKMVENAKRSYGRLFAVARDVMKWSPEKICDEFGIYDKGMPRRLDAQFVGATGQAARDMMVPF